MSEETERQTNKIVWWILGILGSTVLIASGVAVNSQFTLGKVQTTTSANSRQLEELAQQQARIESRIIKLETREEDGTPRSKAGDEMKELRAMIQDLALRVSELTFEVRDLRGHKR